MTPASVSLSKKRPLPRARHACLRCRKQKLRCDDTRPCALCLRVGVECRERPENKGLVKPTAEFPGNNDTSNVGPSDAGQQRALSPRTTLSLGRRPSPASTFSHRNPPPSSTRSPPDSRRRSSEVYQERTSTYEVVDQLFREHNSAARLFHSTDAIPGSSPDARSSEASGHYLPICDLLEMELPPSHVIDYALESYSDSVHWFMLLFHEPSLRAELQGLTTTGFVRADRISFLILVVLVIGIGAKYSTKSEAEEICPGFDMDGLGNGLIHKVEERLLDVFDQANIEAVQISLLLSSYYAYHSRPNRSFALMGSALKVAQALGLQQESHWKMDDPILREVWRRLCWALYTAEVFSAISFGTPCNVHDSDWDVSFPGNIDDTSTTCPGFESVESYEDETFGPVTVASYQRYKFRLYRIASTITRNIYLRSGATLAEVVREIKAINHRLLQWEKCIPQELRLKYLKHNSADKTSTRIVRTFQLQALALQLSYDNIQLVLHRPLLTINRVPRWPHAGPQGGNIPDQMMVHAGDDTVDTTMIKTSKYQCWVSSMRTSKIGEHAEILAASQNTHGAAYAGIQSFTAGVVLGIFALSDPLSDQAHQAKRGVSRIIKLPRLHRFRTTVSDQCGAILEELVRLVLAEEMKALLTEAESSGQDCVQDRFTDERPPVDQLSPATESCGKQSTVDENNVPAQDAKLSDGSVTDIFELFSHNNVELPRDIASGNFSDALVSLQDVFRDGRSGLNTRLGNGSRHQEQAGLSSISGTYPYLQPLSGPPAMSNSRVPNTFDGTSQAWIWDDLLWLPDVT
ncbi:uncharacterized protein PV07_00015 [Cladophialophora immunda]|uniref:Zn(2)-C6 fungal-type domain-containing protein n=1 Tax=Cladophialophora immunda TaxID=569365 RepID=A0A0D2DBQ0_9EURO|nr:uncharacterized protein PV07_00015 [Cladophialophora immunda]KIW33144.1 hypothetical protein PV07_00015 [Cladophialophora immunda]